MLGISRYAVVTSIVAAFLVACGGSQPEISVPWSAAAARGVGRDHGGAWMDGGAAKWDLLYVSSGATVSVYRYWQRTLVGTLTGFKSARGECVDGLGNIYITDYKGNDVVEYAHGGKTLVRTYKANRPLRCAVNLLTGDLAIANSTTDVSVYRHGKGKPIKYTDQDLYGSYAALGYDNDGNLLVTSGCIQPTSCSPATFAYLPRNAKKLTTIYLYGASGYYYFYIPTDILWDGRYWVVTQPPSLYRYSIIGSKATYKSKTTLGDFLICGYPIGGISIYNNGREKPGTQVVGPGYSGQLCSGHPIVGFWSYPSGGSPFASIPHGASAAAISYKKGL